MSALVIQRIIPTKLKRLQPLSCVLLQIKWFQKSRFTFLMSVGSLSGTRDRNAVSNSLPLLMSLKPSSPIN
jgi:hypothetical protein